MPGDTVIKVSFYRENEECFVHYLLFNFVNQIFHLMFEKIIINGATGFIGRKLTSELLKRDYKVVILTRNIEKARNIFSHSSNINFIDWNKLNIQACVDIFESAKSVINLSGESLGGKRWNKGFKDILYKSRINTTQRIIDVIKLCKHKPKSFICASAIGYYGFNKISELDESSPAGNDFLALLCKDWEATALKARRNYVRTVCIRTGIVLDENDGALKKLILPFKLFLGCKQGDGKQWVSWIHINDVAGLIIFAIENNNIDIALNATAPNPVSNKDYCKAIGRVLKRPSLFTVPGFVLKLLIGEFAEYVLTGQKVVPAKALENGYKFEFERIEEALKDIFKKL